MGVVVDDEQAVAEAIRGGDIIEIKIKFVYNMYRMRRFTTITACAG
jgi:hypothetical protein